MPYTIQFDTGEADATLAGVTRRLGDVGQKATEIGTKTSAAITQAAGKQKDWTSTFEKTLGSVKQVEEAVKKMAASYQAARVGNSEELASLRRAADLEKLKTANITTYNQAKAGTLLLEREQVRLLKEQANIKIKGQTSNTQRELELIKLKAKYIKEEAQTRAAATTQGKAYIAMTEMERIAREKNTKSIIDRVRAGEVLVDVNGKSISSTNKVTTALKKQSVAATAASAATKKVGKHFDAAAQFTSSWRASLAGLGSHMGIYTSSTILAASAMYGLTRAIKETIALGSEFSGFMARAAAVMETTVSESVMLEQKVRSLGETTVFTASEVAGGLVFLGMAGQTSQEAMESLEPTLQLASIGMLDMATAADIVTNIMGGFQIPASEVKDVVDDMATAVISANMNIQQLGNSMSYVAPVAESAGVSLQSVVASLEVLHNAGIKSSRAGTGLRKILLSLYNPTNKAKKALADLGVSAVDALGKSRDIIKVLEELNQAGADLGDFQEIVGIRAASAFSQLVKAADGSEEGLRSLRAELDRNTGAAARLQQAVEDFLGADFKKFKSALADVSLDIFDNIVDNLREATTAATDFVKSLTPETIQSMITAVVNLTKAIAGLVAIAAAVKITTGMAAVGKFFIALVGSAALSKTGLMGWVKTTKTVTAATLTMNAALLKTGAFFGTFAASMPKVAAAFAGVSGAVGFFGKALLGLTVSGGVLAFLTLVPEALISVYDWFTKSGTAADTASESVDKYREAYELLNREMGKESRELEKFQEQLLATRDKYKEQLSGTMYRFSIGADIAPEAITTLQEQLKLIDEVSKKGDELQLANEHGVSEQVLNKLQAQYDAGEKALSAARDRMNEAVAEYDTAKKVLSNRGHTWMTDNLLANTKPAAEAATAAYHAMEKVLNELAAALAKAEHSQKAFTDRVEGGLSVTSGATKEIDEMLAKHNEFMSAKASPVAEYKKARAELKKLTDQYEELQNADNVDGSAISALAPKVDKAIKKVEKLKGSYDAAIKSAASADKALVKSTVTSAERIRTSLSDLENVDNVLMPVKDLATRMEEASAKTADLRAQLSALTETEGMMPGETFDAYSKRVAAAVKELKKALGVEKALNKEYSKGLSANGKLWAARAKIPQQYHAILRSVKSVSNVLASQANLTEAVTEHGAEWGLTIRESEKALRDAARAVEEIAAATADVGDQFKFGWNHAIEDVLEKYNDFYGQTKKMVEDLTKSTEDFFVNLFSTGKANWDDLIDYMKTTLIRFLTQQFIMKPILGSLSIAGLGMSGAASAGQFTGSTAGAPGGIGFSNISSILTGNSMSNSLNAGWNALFGNQLAYNASSSLNAGSQLMLAESGVGTPSAIFGGSNLGMGIAGIGGGFIGNMVAPDSQYGSLLGGIGGAGGYSLGAGLTASAAASGGGGFMAGSLAGSVVPVIGTIVGGVLGGLLSKVFSGKPSDKTQYAELSASGESIKTFGFEGDKFSQENRDAAEQIATIWKTFEDTIKAQTGDELATKTLRAKVGSRDGVFAAIGTNEQSFGTDVQAAIEFGMKHILDTWLDTTDLMEDKIEQIRKAFNTWTGAEDKAKGVAAYIEIFRYLDSSPLEDYTEAMDELGKTAWDRAIDLTNSTFEVIDAFDGSADSAMKLAEQLNAQRVATTQVMVAIEQMKQASDALLENTKESIRDSMRTDQEKFDARRVRADELMSQLQTETNYEKISNIVAQIDALVNDTWGLKTGSEGWKGLDDEQKTALRDEFIAYLDAVQESADTQYDKATTAAEESAAMIQAAVEAALQSAASDFQAAANSMQAAASTPTNVNVNVTYTPDTSFEIGR